jgi:DNA-binding transcriptional LysR family regulator
MCRPIPEPHAVGNAWPFPAYWKHEGGDKVSVAYQPVFWSNDWLTLRTMAADGVGIAALPAHVCRRELASGVLERVLPQWRSDHATLTIAARRSAVSAHVCRIPD